MTQIYLLRHIEEIYQLGISKFSGSAKMRLGYVQFLLNKLHKVQQAQKELMEIQDRCDPNYNEQFCIFQLTRKIEQTSLDTGKSKGDNSSTYTTNKMSNPNNLKKVPNTSNQYTKGRIGDIKIYINEKKFQKRFR